MKYLLILTFYVCLRVGIANAQEVKVIYSYSSVNDSLYWQKSKRTLFSSKGHLLSYLEKKQAEYQNKGYLLFSVNTIEIEPTTFNIAISFNRKFTSIILEVSQIPDLFLEKAGYFSDSKHRLILSPKEYLRFKDQILSIAANNGFPFAKIGVSNIAIENEQIKGFCTFLSGSKIFFDSLSISGEININNDFLAYYLGLKEVSGEDILFNQQIVEDIEKKIEKLAYLKLVQSPNVLFVQEKAIVCISLKTEKSNHIDGMLGILPASTANSKLSLNGYLNLHLYNPFGKGKQIMLEWQRVKKSSPSYQIFYSHPQLFKSSLNFEISFLSLQQDSIFRNIQLQAGLTKQLSLYSVLGLYLKKRNGISLAQIHEEYNNLPMGNSKATVNLMGFSYRLNYTDKVLFPKKGWMGSITTEFGKQDLISVQNDSANTQNNSRFIGMLDIKKFSPVTKFCTFVNHLSFAFMSGKQIYNNEMFRMGGINSLRGFDENYFFTPLYLVNRIDLRINLDKRSYFFIFNDIAALKKFDLIDTNAKVITPYSFGSGLNMKVNGGHLKLAIALGATNNNITLSKARFHFGYSAIF